MRPPVPAAVAVSLVACALVGCGSSAGTTAPTTTTGPGAYVAEVEGALRPPGRLASVLTAYPERRPTRGELDALVDDARRRLAGLRAMRLGDARLRTQRDRFTGAYASVVFHMQRVRAALVRGDRVALRRASRPFFASLRGLSSAVSSPR
jgi:hypothetical protein